MIRVGDLREAVGLGRDDRTDDRLLERLEREAVAHLERITNRYYGTPVSRVERLHGGMGRTYTLHLGAPIVTLTSVESLSALGIGSDWTQPWTVASFDYVVGERGLALLDGTFWPLGRRNIRVTYVGGYAAGEEPVDIRGAVVSIVAATYRQGRQTVTPTEGAPQSPAGLVVPGVASAVINSHWRSPGL